MTQPSLNTTFDTSLIDLGSQKAVVESFSTSSSTVPSESGQPPQTTSDLRPANPVVTSGLTSDSSVTPSAPLPSDDYTNRHGMSIRHVSNMVAYDEWASVYDTDGNILQAIDDLELQSLLPELLRALDKDASAQDTLHVIDLGCGTGRNTCKLLQLPWPAKRVQITGYDASRGMLDVAQTKMDTISQSVGGPAELTYRLIQHDFLDSSDVSGPPIFPSSPEEVDRADVIISTLVVEHFPLEAFFRIVSGLLRIGGVILVTNMHEDMGKMSQAGFERKDEHTGEVVKIRGRSWAHRADEVVRAAKHEGLEVVQLEGRTVRETAITTEMVEAGVLSPRGKKWIGIKVWYGMVFRRML